MSGSRIAAGVAAAVVLVVPTVLAHHSFSAEFDSNKPVELKGTVVKVEWINPHTWIHIDVKKPDGGVERWMIEGGTPNTLLRRGLTRESLPAGTEVVVDGYRAKNGTNRANGRDVTFPDGKKLFMGSSGIGAPSDGKDPTEK
ncbi:MAG TPA: DUF6152 family protein [Vicinamibacterales bacterium]|nr:DUF6152 family protein [Vicinamibacterales bacterium]